MTKIREPLSIEQVLSNVIQKLDENDIKNITNKSSSHFRKCSDPDDKDHTLYLSDAIKLDILMQRKSLGTPLLDNFQLMLDQEFKETVKIYFLIETYNERSNFFTKRICLWLLRMQKMLL